MELKTLKDMYEHLDGLYYSANSLGCCEYGCGEAIRNEVIKWINKLKFNTTSSGCLMKLGNIALIEDEKNNEISGAIKILTHVFNITDEELK